LRCYREVTQLRPQYATAFLQLGYCLAAVGWHRYALDAYECALQIRPDFTSVYAHLSLAVIRRRYSLDQGTDNSAPREVAVLRHGALECRRQGKLDLGLCIRDGERDSSTQYTDPTIAANEFSARSLGQS
jgi:hypothetical protein